MKSLLKKLFKSSPVVPQDPATLPDNHRIYCIGDIHGRVDLLKQLHDKIKLDSDTFSGHKTIIYLGDYIDRGPDSKRVIDCILNEKLTNFTEVFLLGNHEQVLLQFVLSEDPTIANDWFKFGGLSTLASYGVEIRGIPTLKDLSRLRTEFTEKLPNTHFEFFKDLTLSFECGDYFFAHAGINPKINLSNQRPEDLLWIREDFINSTLFHKKIIVHGHTVTSEPEQLFNRIGIDTGAYSTGRLTCAVFEETECRFLQTKNNFL